MTFPIPNVAAGRWLANMRAIVDHGIYLFDEAESTT